MLSAPVSPSTTAAPSAKQPITAPPHPQASSKHLLAPSSISVYVQGIKGRIFTLSEFCPNLTPHGQHESFPSPFQISSPKIRPPVTRGVLMCGCIGLLSDWTLTAPPKTCRFLFSAPPPSSSHVSQSSSNPMNFCRPFLADHIAFLADHNQDRSSNPNQIKRSQAISQSSNGMLQTTAGVNLCPFLFGESNLGLTCKCPPNSNLWLKVYFHFFQPIPRF